MKPSMRSRINVLNRAMMIAGVLVASLVIVASRLSVDRLPALRASVAPVAPGAQPAVDVTQTPVIAVPQPMASPTPWATPMTRLEIPGTPEPTVDVSNRIGILAGHWGYDTGAVCADGLREVDITTDIARRTAAQLRSLGYEVDILQEQDPDKPQPPLQNYRAGAFVSLHVDSCLPGASGFKVSRWALSQMPEIEDRLVNCIYQEYAATTGLPHHDSSITIDMWNYYAFREIGEPTPGAIIEMGFMTGDRWLLVEQPDLAARGIVNGLLCFLEGTAEH